MPCNIAQQNLDAQGNEFLDCPDFSLSEKRILAYVLAKVSNAPSGIVTEKYDEIDITYHGSTNNIDTVTYSLAGTVVATVTMTYVGGVPVSDDALLLNVTKS